MAFITKHAGGYASDGSRDVLSIVPSALAETTPLYLGTAGLVKEVESLIRDA
jgi:fructose-1,6-bisphosphatase